MFLRSHFYCYVTSPTKKTNDSINRFDARYCRGLPFSQQISAMSSAVESWQKKDKVINGLVIAIKVGLRQEIDVLKGQTIDQVRKRELLDLSMPLPATSKSKKKKEKQTERSACDEDYLRVCAVHISKYELFLRKPLSSLSKMV